jgi:hypothetical protein
MDLVTDEPVRRLHLGEPLFESRAFLLEGSTEKEHTKRPLRGDVAKVGSVSEMRTAVNLLVDPVAGVSRDSKLARTGEVEVEVFLRPYQNRLLRLDFPEPAREVAIH